MGWGGKFRWMRKSLQGLVQGEFGGNRELA